MSRTSLAERFAAPVPRPLPLLERELGDVMTPGVVTIAENASVRRVFQAFAAHGVHAILVTGTESGRPLGWITVHGLLGWLETSAHRPAREAINERVVNVRASTQASEALKLMLTKGVTHLLVVKLPSGAPEGVVSERDLVAGRGG